MALASDHRAHAARHPADCLILLPQRLPARVETAIGPAHYPAECTQSDAFLQPSLRARKGRANSNSFMPRFSASWKRCSFSIMGSAIYRFLQSPGRGYANLVSVSGYATPATDDGIIREMSGANHLVSSWRSLE